MIVRDGARHRVIGRHSRGAETPTAEGFRKIQLAAIL
jgi:hypothetical protein